MSTAHPTTARRIDLRVLIAGVVAVVVLATMVALGLRSERVRHELALSFTKMPTPYSQLAFAADNPVRTVGSTAQVTFTIGNHEATTTRYSYRIAITGKGDRALGSRTGSVEVEPGRTATVTARVGLRGSPWSEATVTLADRPETLRYLRSSS